MKYTIVKNDRNIMGSITLPSGKCVNNRLLVIKAIKHSDFDAYLPERKIKTELDKAKQDVAIRFIKDFLARRMGEWEIAGAEKKRNKYVDNLVNILIDAGVNIKYNIDAGYPVIRISGKHLNDDIVKIEASAGNQFISVSMLISPIYSQNMTHRIKDKLISASYLKTALKLMKYLGIPSLWHQGEVLFENEFYENKQITVEADWSIAPYYYEMVAFSKNADLTIHGLNGDSLQPEIVVSNLFEKFGIETTFFPDGVHLKKGKVKIKKFEYDFSTMPDLIPAFAVTSAVLNIPFEIVGYEGLIEKQSFCIKNLEEELEKLGVKIEYKGNVIIWNGKLTGERQNKLSYTSCDNQRIAMALAPVSMILDEVEINNPNMIKAVYTKYWDDLRNLGFFVEEPQMAGVV